MDKAQANNANVTANIQHQQQNAASHRYDSPVPKKSKEENPLYTSGTSETPS